MDPNTKPNPPTGGQTQNSNPGVQVPRTPAPTPPQPLIGGTKEAPRPVAQSNEWLSPSTPEIVLPNAVKEAGVEAKPVVQVVPQAAQQAGVRMAKEATPPSTVSVEHISLQTPHPVLVQLKKIHKNVKESFSWLVRLLVRQQDREKNGGNE